MRRVRDCGGSGQSQGLSLTRGSWKNELEVSLLHDDHCSCACIARHPAFRPARFTSFCASTAHQVECKFPILRQAIMSAPGSTSNLPAPRRESSRMWWKALASTICFCALPIFEKKDKSPDLRQIKSQAPIRRDLPVLALTCGR